VTGTVRALLLVLVALLPGAAAALPDDTGQPIHIKAQEVIRDETEGQTVYQGGVTLRQGSIRIAADRVLVRHAYSEADRIIAYGSPATIQQRFSADDEELVYARARTIQYVRAQNRGELRHDAELEQGETVLTSERIDYNLERQVIRASSPETGQRVRMVIPPGRVELRQP